MSSIIRSSDAVSYPPLEDLELCEVNLAMSDEEEEEPKNRAANPSEANHKDGKSVKDMATLVKRPSPSGAGSSLAVDVSQNQQVDKASEDTEKLPTRDRWDNQVEFILSCIAMSVGLGNVWRFPLTAYENGGGAFLVPYLIVLLVLGRPMYYLEMCLGQFCSRGPVKMWEIAPFFTGVGYASMIAACCTVSFYCSIMAITVYYFIQSFTNPLPWSEEICKYPNKLTPSLYEICEKHGTSNQSFSEMYYFSTVFPQLPNIENGIGLPYFKLGVCLLASWLTIFVCLAKGIKSAGKISYFTALFPYAVLLALLLRGMTLPGAMVGIQYFIKPDWSRLWDAQVWFNAVGQCFFSLNVGFGTIIFLSSHNSFRHNVYRDAIVISITDTLTSCLAGCAIFSMLGYLAQSMNVDMSQVTRGGPALAFIAFPTSIAHLKLCPQGFALLFFLMLFTLGVGSALALTGQLITVIRDQFPSWRKWKVALVVCILGFLTGIVYITPGGQFVLTLVNHNGADFIIYITAMLEIIAVAWVYGVNRFCEDIKFMLGKETEIYWRICWAFIMPVGLFALLVYFFATYKGLSHEGIPFPTSALVYGWALTGSILSALPICAVLAVRNSPGDSWIEKLRASFKPLPTWGPKVASEREAWTEMKAIAEIDKIKASTDQLSNASTVPPTSRSSSIVVVEEK